MHWLKELGSACKYGRKDLRSGISWSRGLSPPRGRKRLKTSKRGKWFRQNYTKYTKRFTIEETNRQS